MTKTCNQADDSNGLICIDIEVKWKQEGEKHNTFTEQLWEMRDWFKAHGNREISITGILISPIRNAL